MPDGAGDVGVEVAAEDVELGDGDEEDAADDVEENKHKCRLPGVLLDPPDELVPELHDGLSVPEVDGGDGEGSDDEEDVVPLETRIGPRIVNRDAAGVLALV